MNARQRVTRLWSSLSRGRLPLAVMGLLIFAALFLLGGDFAVGAQTAPTISIGSVVANESVTFRTHNYPANQTFTVIMGKIGTQGIDGYVVGTVDSGDGGSMTATFPIPAALQGDYRIAIRLQSPAGYYSYNWFYNDTTVGAQPAPGTDYSGIPTFDVTAVSADKTVTIGAKNVPPNRSFTVRMGAMGTRGVNGIVVETFNSGEGGAFSDSYVIPAALHGSYRIAIRLQSADGYYAYNWFYNNTTGAGTTPTTPAPTSTPAPPAYTGTPTFSITAVQRNETVTIRTKDFPPERTFTVTMGAFGTRGINGIVVDTTASGDGGEFTAAYPIPEALQGSYRIAIRLQSSDGYYAYNWFYNNSTN